MALENSENSSSCLTDIMKLILYSNEIQTNEKKSTIVLPPNSRPPNSLSPQIHSFISISKKLLIHGF